MPCSGLKPSGIIQVLSDCLQYCNLSYKTIQLYCMSGSNLISGQLCGHLDLQKTTTQMLYKAQSVTEKKSAEGTSIIK